MIQPNERICFSVFVHGAVFGIPVDAVQTIFRIQSATPVPLGPPDIAGLVNLRGKVVTAVCLMRRLGISEQAGEASGSLAVAIEHNNELFALLVESVGDAMTCRDADRLSAPAHVSAQRARLTSAYYRVNDIILPVLDIDALFDIKTERRERARLSSLSAPAIGVAS